MSKGAIKVFLQLDPVFVVIEIMESERRIKPIGISLPCDVVLKGKERAAAFRMKFSHYIGMLIEKDYEQGKTSITIHARPPDDESGTELRI